MSFVMDYYTGDTPALKNNDISYMVFIENKNIKLAWERGIITIETLYNTYIIFTGGESSQSNLIQ